jgi:D-serine deaminase-like pyridoxal phosphate-dependent protein
MRLAMPPDPFDRIDTPALLLDEPRMTRNIDRLAARAAALGVQLRPHIKTAKSEAVARRLLDGPMGAATVSTLAEAEALYAAGYRDILYAVGIAPQKLPRVQALRAQGCNLTVLLDSPGQAEALRACHPPVPALIEIDCDGHRGGLRPDDPLLVVLGRTLHAAGCLAGVMTHAGESYGVSGPQAHAAFAEQERRAVVRAADILRAAGLPCPVVSVGSTPTAHAAQDLTGVTELRAGVYVFFDLVMAGIGVCRIDDIALSVLTTVIGHQQDKGWILVDAGWMALSRDRGTAAQEADQGYGLVCDAKGRVLPDLIVSSANQEHGIIACRPGSGAKLPDLPIGTHLRILPNHACATAAQHSGYHVLSATGGTPAFWPRFGGW